MSISFSGGFGMDLAALLHPLSASVPCGEDLSFSTAFDAIQAARRADDPSLSQGDWVTELKEADWPAAVRLCTELLMQQTKDLRVAVWLTEAWTQCEGLAGLEAGYRLVAGLCERYWATLHPLPDEGDDSLRAGSLAWLMLQSTRLLRQQVLVADANAAFTLADIELATMQANIAGRGGAQMSAGSTSELERIEQCWQSNDGDAIRHRLHGVQAVARALDALQAVVDARLGDEAPGFGAVRALLDEFAGMLRRRCPGADAAFSMSAQTMEVPNAEGTGPAAVQVSMAGVMNSAVASRAQALQQLRQVAAFFRRTEPHSPVAYLADKAAQWGEMPLHEWLQAVLKDEGALARIDELLGVERSGSR